MFPLCAKIDAFPHFAKRIDKNREKDNGSPRRNLHLIREEQPSETPHITDDDG